MIDPDLEMKFVVMFLGGLMVLSIFLIGIFGTEKKE